jgi:ferritin-like metal-binding protein YciE
MAELTPLDEKLGEVLGLAQAAQDSTQKVARLADNEELVKRLDRMRVEAEETERRVAGLVDALEGRKTKIQDKGRETKGEAAEMMKIYLGDDSDELDGFEFLSMAEAGELAHWEIVRQMSEKLGDENVLELADWAIPIQQGHQRLVRESSLELAAEEAGG